LHKNRHQQQCERDRRSERRLHLLLAYVLEKVERDGKTLFLPRHWKLLTLQDAATYITGLPKKESAPPECKRRSKL